MINSAAIAATNPALHFFPREAGCRVLLEVGRSALQFVQLPVVDGNVVGVGSEIVPEILNELKFLRRTQVENRRLLHAHALLLSSGMCGLASEFYRQYFTLPESR